MTCKRDRIQENASEYIVINCPATYEKFKYYGRTNLTII